MTGERKAYNLLKTMDPLDSRGGLGAVWGGLRSGASVTSSTVICSPFTGSTTTSSSIVSVFILPGLSNFKMHHLSINLKSFKE